jgi:hypothetical protein
MWVSSIDVAKAEGMRDWVEDCSLNSQCIFVQNNTGRRVHVQLNLTNCVNIFLCGTVATFVLNPGQTEHWRVDPSNDNQAFSYRYSYNAEYY